MKIIAISVVLMSLVACNQKTKHGHASSLNEEKIDGLLGKMYYEDRHNDFVMHDTAIFSYEIIELNRRCDSVTLADIQRIEKSNHPNEKPLLREGSRVSSFYEGVTDYVIEEIKSVDEKIEITVALSNKNYPAQNHWNEKIIMIEQNGLKIENIYFNKDISNRTEPSLKEYLEGFIHQMD